MYSRWKSSVLNENTSFTIYEKAYMGIVGGVVLVFTHVHYFTVIVLEFYCPFYCLVSRHHAILLQQFTVARAEGHT